MPRQPRCKSFDFFPEEWTGDQRVQVMTAEQRGVYLGLVLACWQSETPGILPSDRIALAKLAQATPEEWGRSEQAVGQCFDRSDGHWIHRRVRRDYEAQSARTRSPEHQSRAGLARASRSSRDANGKFLANNLLPPAATSRAPAPPSLLPSFPPNKEPEHLVPDGTENAVSEARALCSKAHGITQDTKRLTAEFERLWAKYPHWGRRSLRSVSLKRWLALRPRPEIEAVLDGLNAAMASEDWKKQSGEFVPGMQVWILAHGWDSSNGNGHTNGKAEPWYGPATESPLARSRRWRKEGVL